jgi:CHAT domain-containing protein
VKNNSLFPARSSVHNIRSLITTFFLEVIRKVIFEASREAGKKAFKCPVLPAAMIVGMVALNLAAFAQIPDHQLADPRSTSAQQSPSVSTQNLHPGQTVSAEIAGGQTHRYQIFVQASQFVRVSYQPQGINLSGAFFDAGGQQVSESTSPFVMREPKNIYLLTEIAGNYFVELRSYNADAGKGKYTLTLEEHREIRPPDRPQVAGDKAWRDAERFNEGITENGFKKAVEKFLEAATHFEASGDVRRQSQALRFAATHYSALGEKRKAIEVSLKSLPLSRKAEDPRNEANLLLNVGFWYADIGEYQKSVEYTQQGLELTRKINDKRLEGMALGSLGRVHRVLGDKQRAVEYFEAALVLKRQAKDKSAEAVSLANLGTIYSEMGLHQKAVEVSELALRLCEEAENMHLAAIAKGHLATAWHEAGDNPKALACLEQMLAACLRSGDKKNEAAARYQTGHILFEMGDYQKAADSLRQALVRWQEVGHPRGEAATHFYLSRCALAQQKLTEADAEIELALGITEKQRVKFDQEDMRSQYFSSVQIFYELKLEVLHALSTEQPDQKYPDQKYIDAALEISERARARSLLDMLSQSSVDIRQGVSAELKSRELHNQTRLSSLQTQLLQLRQQAKPDARTVAALATEVRKADEEGVQIEREIRQQSPRYAELKYPTTLRADEIRGLLDEQTALLEYSLGEKKSFLFVVTRDSVRSFVLPEAQIIQQQVELLRRSIRQPGRREFAGFVKAANNLYEMLIAPAASLIASKQRLLISPDKHLYSIPFESLITKPGNTGFNDSFRKVDYLIRHWSVGYLPSASILSSLRQQRKEGTALSSVSSREAREFMAVADPIYQPQLLTEKGNEPGRFTQVALRSMDDSSSHLELPQLSESRKEALQIASLFGQRKSALLLSDKAREEDLKNSPDLSTARRIHFATHGLISERQPQLSGLVLTLDNDPAEDGLLQMREIFNLKLNAELVVLSACETGLGKEMKGEGVIGLTRAFQYAGASNVVVSLWRVADRSTADLMIDFYRHMQSGLDKAPALRRAKLQMIEGGTFSHPYYWAAFVMNGEAR